MQETFVLIIGGGPVGLSAAIDLGQRGVDGILVTENLETARHPRCNAVNARTMEHFRRLGISGEIRQSAPLNNFPPRIAYATRFCGFEFAEIDILALRSSDPSSLGGALGPEPGVTISQLFLEPILRKHAESGKRIDVRFGWRVTELMSDGTATIAFLENVKSGERKQIAARYVLAADGARSLARRHCAVGMRGSDGTLEGAFVSGTMLTYFIKAPTLMAESARRPAILTWILNHDLRAFVFAQDGGTHWIVHYNVPDGRSWEDVDHDAVLRAVFGKSIPYSIVSQGPWTGGLSLVADAYRCGNTFFAGDAAHLYTPLGAFGMNTGVGDALNLTWKLAAIYAGWGGPGLLDSYETERRPIGIRNSKLGIHCSVRKGKWSIPLAIEHDDKDGEVARAQFGKFVARDDVDEYFTIGLQLGERYENSPIVCDDGGNGPPDSWSKYVPTDRPGCRAPHFRLPDDSAFFDALGPDYTLVVFDDETDPAPLREAARSRNMPLTVRRTSAPAGLYQKKSALIRPDHHVAWHGDAVPADSKQLIDKIRGG